MNLCLWAEGPSQGAGLCSVLAQYSWLQMNGELWSTIIIILYNHKLNELSIPRDAFEYVGALNRVIVNRPFLPPNS